MIFVSSSCSKKVRIDEAIEELVNEGFRNIELSGGTELFEGLEDALVALKKKHNLNLLLHNYFPPPSEHFVLNLASLDNLVHQQSVDHCKRAIELASRLETDRYSIHAGFFIDIKLREIGKKLTKDNLFDAEAASSRFVETAQELIEYGSSRGIKLYFENNVISKTNYESFEGSNPLMLTNDQAYRELKEKLDFNLLLDVAHLLVSCNTMGLNFEDNILSLSGLTDYIHISDNDGFHDQNRAIDVNGRIMKNLEKIDLRGKKVSLEIYENYDRIRESYQLIEELNA